MPNFKRIGGGPWKNCQKSDDLTWNDPDGDENDHVNVILYVVSLIEIPALNCEEEHRT